MPKFKVTVTCYETHEVDAKDWQEAYTKINDTTCKNRSTYNYNHEEIPPEKKD
jgi:hypothetical protein